MVTRCGDIAPSIVTFIMKKENLSIEEMERILSFKSGISGLAGTEPDYRMVKESAEQGNENAKLAINLFEKGTANFIAEYAVTMGGLDTIVFTSGIGENDALVRANIIKRLEFFGAKIDEEVNNASNGKEAKISTADSKIGIYVIPTDEEAIIAEDTEKLIGNK
jgi:acetate kinase